FGTRLAVAFEYGCWQLLILGIGCLLGRALPGGLRSLPLFLHGSFETCLIEVDTTVADGILHEVQRQTESIVQFESIAAFQTPASLPNICPFSSGSRPGNRSHYSF